MTIKIRDKFLNRIVILGMLFCSGTVIGSHNAPIFLSVCFLLLLIIGCYKSIFFSKKSIGYIKWIVIFIILTILLNRDLDFISYIGVLLPIMIGFLASSIFGSVKLIEEYVNVIVFLSILSLIFLSIGLINPEFILSLPDANYNHGNKTLFFLHNYQYDPAWNMQVQHDWRVYARNFGIFREPGVYQFFLNLALVFLLFFEGGGCGKSIWHTKEKRMAAIIIVTIFSTLSTAGIFGMACILAAFLVNKKKINREYMIVSMFVILFCILFGDEVFISKLSSSGVSRGSYDVRINMTISDIRFWLNAPIFGSGISKYESCTSGSTNGITFFLAEFGITVIGIEMVMLFRFVKHLCRKKISLFLLGLGVIALLSSQQIMLFPMLQTLIFTGFKIYEDPNYVKDMGDFSH